MVTYRGRHNLKETVGLAPSLQRQMRVASLQSFGMSGHKHRAMGEQCEGEGGLQSMAHNKWLREWHLLP